ncbi:MAG: hypothetical protein FWD61_20335 [Phycisphaerales bacterium]|nr:hypothetical protein [Phycisphaerales bacterium]
MNYARNKLYFEQDKVPTIKSMGCAPIVLMIIGVILLFSAGSSGAVGALLGLVFIGIGVLLIVNTSKTNAKNKKEADTYNKNRTKGEELDKASLDYLANLEPMALDKLNIERRDANAADPIRFHGYHYENIEEYARGKDGRERTSKYNVVIFFFSKDQIYCYKFVFDLLRDWKEQKVTEYFYKDIVSVDSETRTRKFQFGGNDKPIEINVEDFLLTTSGGTSISASIFVTEEIKDSLKGMKSLLRHCVKIS